MYVNSNGSEYSWMFAGMLYVLALFLVQFLQPTNSLHAAVRFNIVTAAMVTFLSFVDTLIFTGEYSRTSSVLAMAFYTG